MRARGLGWTGEFQSISDWMEVISEPDTADLLLLRKSL
jgi:hypothetical protein